MTGNSRIWTIGTIVAGILVGVGLWAASRKTAPDGQPTGNAALHANEQAQSASRQPAARSPSSRGDEHLVAAVREPAVDAPTQAQSPVDEPRKPVIAEKDLRQLRRAIGAPHQFDWQQVASSDMFNPRHVDFDSKVKAAIEATVAGSKPLLTQLGAEAAQTTRDELADLKAAGHATIIKNGESPFVKVGKDAVYTVAMGGADSIAASKSMMPRLLEVEARLQSAGKDTLLAVARIMHEHGILLDSEHATIDKVIKSWQP